MIEAHPFADIFPMLGAGDAAELRADIAAHGLRDRVVLFAGQILDGRNRYRALVDIAKLGLAYRGNPLTVADLVPMSAADIEWGDFYEDFAGTEAEALEFVLSKNLHRRHLDESQRAMVAANLAGLKPGRPPSEKAANLPVFRQAEAAERLHVSERSVRDARVVRASGVGELQSAVERGDLKVSSAAVIARGLADLPAEDQARIIREHAAPKALSRVAKEMRAEKQAAKAEKREERERALGAKLAALPDKRYGVIIADPEWRYEVWSEETGRDRSPDNHYPTSDLDAIKARPVADIAADDCVLFLWVTVPFLDAGLTVLAAWGFRYVTHLVWIKDRSGVARGTGYWFTGEHEVVLVGKRGTPPAPTPGTQFPSYFRADFAGHSVKPDTVHEIAEAYFPNLPKIELNARRSRAGWDVWGLESDGGECEPAEAECPPDADGAPSRSPSASDTTDADAIASLTASLSAALGVAPSIGGADGRLASPDERRLRRAVILAAHQERGISTRRIAAALGIRQQSVHEQIQAARAEAGRVAE